MNMVSWSPFRELEHFFNRYGQPGTRAVLSGDNGDSKRLYEWRPAANISETDAEYLIKAELPEVAKEDIDVSVTDGIITIKGERRLEKKDDSEKQHRIESFYGSFSRSFSLPADVDEAAIHAESKDGVLTVRLPKVEAKKPRSVEVSVR